MFTIYVPAICIFLILFVNFFYREEAVSKVPWLPSYFRVAEITDENVSGWIKTENELIALKILCESSTGCSLIPR